MDVRFVPHVVEERGTELFEKKITRRRFEPNWTQ
jgi:hypothetical protein